MTPAVTVDPFELPEWLGLAEVTWVADEGIRIGPHVRGRLTGTSAGLRCDLLAVDTAYPRPVVDEETRQTSHAAWQLGEVHLVEYDSVLTITVPGTLFTADGVLDALGRVARAVGADPERYTVALRIGATGPSRTGDHDE